MGAKIAIDAGHGLYTAGKRCMKKLDSKETREWTLNSRIANKLEEWLSSFECQVLRVDDRNGKNDITLAERVKKANDWGADVYISIHHNAGVKGGAGGGTEVYYYSNNPERERQAKALYNSVVAITGLRGNRSTPVKKYGFYVVKHTKMPAFLIEDGFMDSSVDVPVILSDAHANNTAMGLLNFIVNEFKLSANNAVKPSPKPEVKNDVLYKVQVGAFENKANAEALKERLQGDGYEAVIVSG